MELGQRGLGFLEILRLAEAPHEFQILGPETRHDLAQQRNDEKSVRKQKRSQRAPFVVGFRDSKPFTENVFEVCRHVRDNKPMTEMFPTASYRPAGDIVGRLFKAFSQAHNGEMPDDLSALLSYATTASQQEAIQKLILKKSSGK